MTPRGILIAGALLAAAGVALGAFGAHGLEARLQQMGRGSNLDQRMAWFETGVRYHMYHALAIVAVAALAGRTTAGTASLAAWGFVVGIVLFSGSLYGLTFAGDAWRKLGMVTPLGGLAFLVGWIALAVGAWRVALSAREAESALDWSPKRPVRPGERSPGRTA